MNISERLKYFMKDNNINQTAFAKKCNISVGNMSDIMNDKINPSSSALQKIAEEYQINLNWLLTGEGSMYIDGKNKKNLKNSVFVSDLYTVCYGFDTVRLSLWESNLMP